MNLSLSSSSYLGASPFSELAGSMDRSRFGNLKLSSAVRAISLTESTSQVQENLPPVNSTKSHKKSFPQANSVVKEASDYASLGPPIETLLTDHELTIKYKKGDKVVPRLKSTFKTAKLHKKVKFRSDKNLEWSPQFFLDKNLTTLQGYMSVELLRLNLIEQLNAWNESDSSSFDDRTDSEEEISDESEVNEKAEEVSEVSEVVSETENIKNEDSHDESDEGEEED